MTNYKTIRDHKSDPAWTSMFGYLKVTVFLKKKGTCE